MAAHSRILIWLIWSLNLLNAADISGTVLVRHKLTRKKITVSADMYSRGVLVPLDKSVVEDALEYERSPCFMGTEAP